MIWRIFQRFLFFYDHNFYSFGTRLDSPVDAATIFTVAIAHAKPKPSQIKATDGTGSTAIAV